MSIESILAEHELELSVFISDIGTCAAPDCDWRKGSMRNGEVAAAHRAHLADLIRAALTGDEVEAAAGAAVFGRRPDLGRALSRQIAAAALGGAADALGGER